MDYYSLNNQTIKNNYPLPLITDLINNIGRKKVFTKMDLQWSFNNVRIKKENEQKGAFTMHILDWQTHNNAIFGAKSFLNTFPIVLISAINHLAIQALFYILYRH